MAAEDERCEKAMGCDGEKCVWSASRHSCQSWCTRHASQWADRVTKAIKCAGDRRSPALLIFDRLSMSGQKGMLVRRGEKQILEVIPRLVDCGDPSGPIPPSEIAEMVTEYLSKSGISTMSLTVTACGLMGNPPQHVVDAWNSQYSCVDLLEFAKWMGYPKKSVSVSAFDANKFMFRDANGTYKQIDEKQACAEITSLMSDHALKGARMMFCFDILTTAWDLKEMVSACEAFDAKTPGGVNLFKNASGYGGRTFIYEPGVACAASPQSCASGGVHVSLDCGSFVAQWHTVAHMTASFPMVRDGRATFKIVMLW